MCKENLLTKRMKLMALMPRVPFPLSSLKDASPFETIASLYKVFNEFEKFGIVDKYVGSNNVKLYTLTKKGDALKELMLSYETVINDEDTWYRPEFK